MQILQNVNSNFPTILLTPDYRCITAYQSVFNLLINSEKSGKMTF
ncbi:hypothetical protein MGWOODY_Tha1647 [hydrothermal vent metagenome]|uniref:Uncharacterized protein n=1 Tax=hydrothermal vent metagenome TaxID=652676 RepID=A0A160TGQ9_9ZZZZ